MSSIENGSHPETATSALETSPATSAKKVGLSTKVVALVLTATAVSLLALGLIEGVLRIAHVGFPMGVTVPCTIKGAAANCDNLFFASAFFPPGMIRLPRPYAIPVAKARTTYRIVILGESAAFGDPEPAYGFSRYLEVMLRERFPGTQFEVINTGVTAINSHVVRPIAEDMAKHQPDMFIVYMGNNEVVGPFGPGTVLTGHTFELPAIRASIALKSTRVGQLISRVVAGSNSKGTKQWGGMEMFLDEQVRADDPELSATYRNFRTNLENIISAGSKAKTSVLLATVGSNLRDCGPFASSHRKGMSGDELQSWSEAFDQGKRLEQAGLNTEAAKAYTDAEAIDATYAELQFRMARVLHAMGEFAEAEKRFRAARDLDVLRFRTDTHLNEIIREVARTSSGVTELVDVEQAIAQEAPNGIPGDEVFYEHVHFNPHGNYVVARTLFRAIARRFAADKAVTDVPEEECNELLALTDYDRSRVAQQMMERLERAPFATQPNHEQQLKDVSADAELTPESFPELDAKYRRAIERAPNDRILHLNYGYLLYRTLPYAAAEQFRKAQPYDGVPFARFGR